MKLTLPEIPVNYGLALISCCINYCLALINPEFPVQEKIIAYFLCVITILLYKKDVISCTLREFNFAGTYFHGFRIFTDCLDNFFSRELILADL